jgi:hypothetical protein
VVSPTPKDNKSELKKQVDIGFSDMVTLREAEVLAKALEKAERRERNLFISPDYRIAGWESALALKVQGRPPQTAQAKGRIDNWQELVSRHEQLKEDLAAAQELSTMTTLPKTERLARPDALLAKYVSKSSESSFRARERLRSSSDSALERTAASDAPRMHATSTPPPQGPHYTLPEVTSSSLGMSSGLVAEWSMWREDRRRWRGAAVQLHSEFEERRGQECGGGRSDPFVGVHDEGGRSTPRRSGHARQRPDGRLHRARGGPPGEPDSVHGALPTDSNLAQPDGPTLRRNVKVDSRGGTLWLGGEL